MAFKMRTSKFRHVFGQALKKDQCYDNIRISKSSLDSTFCSVNPKYVAIITEAAGGGAFLVLPLSRTGRVERDHPLVSGHKAAVLDIKFCPHNDDVIASCSEDCTVKVWQIPEEGVLTTLTEPVEDLVGHQRRVHFIEWHPTALNLLLSSGADNKILLWNCGIGEVVLEVDMPDLCLSFSFSYDGAKFVTTCKDKNLRVFDARNGKMLMEGKGHEGAKPSQCVYLKDDKIFTTGFSKMSERQYALWDAKNLESPINIEVIDTSNGVIFPFYDPDTSMIWLCGKGDSIIRYYEITDEAPCVHFLTLYQSNQPQRGIGMMPKRGLNVNNCEIARFYKLLNNGLCEVIPFTVPRKSDLFQDDLYPDTASDTFAVTADEFLEGKKSSYPIMISLKSGYVPTKKEKFSSIRRPNVLNTPSKQMQRHEPTASGNGAAEATSPAISQSHSHHQAAPSHHQATPSHHHATTAAPSSTHAPAHAPTHAPAQAQAPTGPTLPPGYNIEKLIEDVSDLKASIKQQDEKIAMLENRMSEFEGAVTEITNDDK